MQVLAAETILKDTFANATTVTSQGAAAATANELQQQRNKILHDIQEILKNAEISSQECQQSKQAETVTPSSDVAAENSFVESSNQFPYAAAANIPGISQLLPHLFLCGAGAAMPHILDQLGIGFIVNIAPELPDTPLSSISKPLYLRIQLLDRPTEDISTHFDEVADMIEQVHRNGGKTVVHCVAGVSRSASLCLAYLMKYANMSLREAYNHVKSIRPQIRPNSGFFQQLRCYEERLRGTQSIQMVFYESLNREIPDVYEPEYKAMEEFYQKRRQRHAIKQR